jgi:hypothetical protein
MSDLPGHARITQKAVALVSGGTDPVYRALGSAHVPVNVVARDLIDVVILGHWADFGQCHHFMRRFDGQSERQAYDENVHWIWRNALDAAAILSRQLALTGPARSAAPTSSQPLGNALHALQDSFAMGHAEREAARGSLPGAIRRIKRYAGADKDGHEEADKQWRGNWREGFSESGWFAVEATSRLLRLVVEAATAARGSRPGALPAFDQFRQQWLAPSDALSHERDVAFDLIDRYTTGLRLGATNIKTIDMDEDGLAQALYTEAGTNTALVLGVFQRLDEQYNSDADDVAEIYVNLIRKNPGRIQPALQANPALVKVLIKVMAEGWTSSGEADCIRWLEGLK